MDAVLNASSTADTGVPAGAQLLALVDAVETGRGSIGEAREALEAVVGKEGAMEAAATVAVFNGLIRVADGTGIQLDTGVKAVSEDDRARFGINDYSGATSTPNADLFSGQHTRITSVRQLFG